MMSVYSPYAFTARPQETVRRKVFVSYYGTDRLSADMFVDQWKDVFVPRFLNVGFDDDLIKSTNTEYVMRKIRSDYLDDSTVTIVLLGSCTHSRRFIDWEIKASLQQGDSLPNGLIGILLPGSTSAHLPPRFASNWEATETKCYARYRAAPANADQLRSWIEDAFTARTTRSRLISNSNDMMKYNAECKVCGVTH